MTNQDFLQADTKAIMGLMNIWGQSVRSRYDDDTLTEEDIALRANLIVEEVVELLAAMGFTLKVDGQVEAGERQSYTLTRHPDTQEGVLHDPQETLDALGDIIYVTKGAGLSLGMDVDKAVLHAIHPSNMSKLDENSQPIKRADGKIMKSESYFPPNERLKGVLEEGLSQ